MIKNYIRIRNISEYFLSFSVLGWLYEVVWWGLIENNAGFTNRGFLFDPWLPIYGFGMLLVMAVQKKLKISNPYMVFLSGMIITVSAELAGSYLMEMVSGEYLWSYEGFFLNYEGRIALKPAILFGLLVLFAVKEVNPKLAELQERYRNAVIHNLLFGIVSACFLIDLLARFWLGSNL